MDSVGPPRVERQTRCICGILSAGSGVRPASIQQEWGRWAGRLDRPAQVLRCPGRGSCVGCDRQVFWLTAQTVSDAFPIAEDQWHCVGDPRRSQRRPRDGLTPSSLFARETLTHPSTLYSHPMGLQARRQWETRLAGCTGCPNGFWAFVRCGARLPTAPPPWGGDL